MDEVPHVKCYARYENTPVINNENSCSTNKCGILEWVLLTKDPSNHWPVVFEWQRINF